MPVTYVSLAMDPGDIGGTVEVEGMAARRQLKSVKEREATDLHTPQATVHSSLVELCWFAWHSIQRSCVSIRDERTLFPREGQRTISADGAVVLRSDEQRSGQRGQEDVRPMRRALTDIMRQQSKGIDARPACR